MQAPKIAYNIIILVSKKNICPKYTRILHEFRQIFARIFTFFLGGGGHSAPTNMSFVSTGYLKYQQNIDRNSSFRTWKCEIFLNTLSPRSLAYN